MRALTPRRRLYGQQGASMALILALIAVLGLSVGAIALQGSSGMLAVQGVKNQRSDVYGAENAVDGAINYIRNDLKLGRPGTDKCAQPGETANPPVIFTGPSDYGDVTVTCRVYENGWGIPVSPPNYPAYAILTTGGLPDYPVVNQASACGDDPGICLEGNASGRVEVHGAVYSNASSTSKPSITSPNGVKLDAGDDSVLARGTCTPLVITGTPTACQTGNPAQVNDPGGAFNVDPTSGAWASEIQTMPPRAPQPTCNATTKVATMVPGSYFEHDEMIAGFSNPPGSSTNRCTVVWMQPGNYYFDFEEPTLGDDWELWRIGHDDLSRGGGLNSAGRVVIGGVRKGWDSTTQASVVIDKVPGACDTTVSGVQAVFAGQSTFDIKHEGRLELCPPVYSDRQQIAIYGRKSNQTASATSLLFRPAGATGATPASFGTPFNPNLVQIDPAAACTLATCTSGTQTGSNKTNQVTLTGFAPTSPALPQQSFASAVLTVKHREVTVPANVATIRATVTPSSGSSCNTTSAFTRQTNLTSQTWTVPCIDSLADLTGATVKWEVTGSTSGSSSSLVTELDGAALTATYTPVPMRKKTDASQIVWMYGAWPTGNTAERQPEIYIWGTVYAPTSRIDLNFGDVDTTKAQFKRGVVVAGIKVNALRSDQDEPAFANPFPTLYTDRYVELIAKIGTTRHLRAVVRLTDDDPATPGKNVQVVRWNAVN